MTQQELDSINEARAICHGASAAIAIHLCQKVEIDFEALRVSIQKANGLLADVLNPYGYPPKERTA